MYGIALSVAACLRSGTRADVAWVVEAEDLSVPDRNEAVAFTPGGGRIGSLLSGVLDGQLADLAGRWSQGRLVEVEVGQTDALIAGLPSGGRIRSFFVPADTIPPDLWDLASSRRPFALVCTMEGDEVTEIDLHTDDTLAGAPQMVHELWASGVSVSARDRDSWVSVFRPVPQLVVVGHSPVAAALEQIGPVLGWHPHLAGDAASATGVIATLSPMDAVVVTAHDLELAGTALMAALDSDAGYIGSLGSRRMQENRADWLAYRGVEDLSRIYGPAGLDIGAETPGEIAVAILAQAIEVLAGDQEAAVEAEPAAG